MKNNPTNVLLISVDGLNPKLIFEAETYGLNIPNITKLFILNGTYSRKGAKGVFPTFTYPSHQSMITGTHPAKHGISNNSVFDPFNIHQGAWNWFVSDKVKNLWECAKENGYVSASVLFPTSVGAKGDFIIPEFWRDGTLLDNKILNQISTPIGLIKELEPLFGALPSGFNLLLEDDLKRLEITHWLLENKLKTASMDKPFFMTVYLASYDETGHINGVFSREALDVIERLDLEISKLIQHAGEVNTFPLTVCLVSDHGLLDNVSNIHPNVILQQNGLINLDEKGNIITWRAYSQRSGGISEIHLNNPDDLELYKKTEFILNTLAQDPESGISEVLNYEQIKQRQGFPGASFALIAKKGYEIRDAVKGDYLTFQTTQKAQHGYDENYEEMQASFFVYGPNIQTNTDIGPIKLIDVAPTLAEIMGFTLPDAQGRNVLNHTLESQIMQNTIKELLENNTIIKDISQLKETIWINENVKPYESIKDQLVLKVTDIEDARQRLNRFASFIQTVYQETIPNHGMIESPLQRIDSMRLGLNLHNPYPINGNLFIKLDSHLAIAGSIKARGGIYEILKFAETLAIEKGYLNIDDDYKILAEDRFKELFSKYTIQVGSTGNLGLSIGMISSKLGFKVIVHMSNDAKAWKKKMLRDNGVTVIEYESNYCDAVEAGRLSSLKDPFSYFVDDEQSKDLFLGYSVAGSRLRDQLNQQGITVDHEHPLFVYLPCGIGGAPGGVTFGLKEEFGDNVHCFFVEPTEACCMLLGLASKLHNKISVQDLGISGQTRADGLAVTRASAFVGPFIEPMISGVLSIEDKHLFDYMRMLNTLESIKIEPSACAAFGFNAHSEALSNYISKHYNSKHTSQITHIAWATGGSLVPQEEYDAYTLTFL